MRPSLTTQTRACADGDSVGSPSSGTEIARSSAASFVEPVTLSRVGVDLIEPAPTSDPDGPRPRGDVRGNAPCPKRFTIFCLGIDARDGAALEAERPQGALANGEAARPRCGLGEEASRPPDSNAAMPFRCGGGSSSSPPPSARDGSGARRDKQQEPAGHERAAREAPRRAASGRAAVLAGSTPSASAAASMNSPQLG